MKTWRDELFDEEFKAHPLLNNFDRRANHMEDNTTSVSNSPIDTGTPTIQDKCDLFEEFINVTITPVECSIICPSELIDRLWKGMTDELNISKEEYLAIQVDGDGIDTGSRVLQISAPLASNNISLFFLATYYSDYVLVPSKAKKTVLDALKNRGFQYANTSNCYVLDRQYNPKKNQEYPEKLVSKTFQMFNDAGVAAQVDTDTKLLLTGLRTSDNQMYMMSIIKTVLSPPGYFSITLSNNEVSLMLEQKSIELFPKDSLQGSLEEFVIPVSFDLQSLPENSTGIVSGVASKIRANTTNVHMSYLSTAQSGLLLLFEEDATTVMRVLRH